VQAGGDCSRYGQCSSGTFLAFIAFSSTAATAKFQNILHYSFQKHTWAACTLAVQAFGVTRSQEEEFKDSFFKAMVQA
jgi:hypothetical protein